MIKFEFEEAVEAAPRDGLAPIIGELVGENKAEKFGIPAELKMPVPVLVVGG